MNLDIVISPGYRAATAGRLCRDITPGDHRRFIGFEIQVLAGSPALNVDFTLGGGRFQGRAGIAGAPVRERPRLLP
jgi:hypothetical protein